LERCLEPGDPREKFWAHANLVNELSSKLRVLNPAMPDKARRSMRPPETRILSAASET
jgi:hypothetical protein